MRFTKAPEWSVVQSCMILLTPHAHRGRHEHGFMQMNEVSFPLFLPLSPHPASSAPNS